MPDPMKNGGVQLTLLNSMAGSEVEESFDRQVSWGIKVLDLKDSLYGKGIEDLDPATAEKIHLLAEARKLRVHTLSSCLFSGDVEEGETAFRGRYRQALDRLLATARILKPGQIRLLSASTSRRAEIKDSSEYLATRLPWVYDVYREAVDRITAEGFRAVIENEVGPCIFSSTAEILGFFRRLDCHGRVSLIWDIQNLWQTGIFPSLKTYQELKPLLAMIHVKGGRSEKKGGRLKWRSGLEKATWPVVPVVSQAVKDGVSPVICLNPSHGETPVEGYEPDYKADLEFLRLNIPGIV